MTHRLVARPARPADHPVFAAFSLELHTGDPIVAPARWVSEMMPHTFFLEDEGGDPRGPCGYAYVESYGERGYVRHVVVRADRRGTGVGRALMGEIARRLRARGASRWELNVKRDNVPAIALYESLGMRTAYTTVVTRIEWSDVGRLPAPTAEWAVVDVAREHEAAVEARFALPAGQVARLREAPGDLVRCAFDARGAVVAFARMNPTFPGCFPFRAESPAIARALLEHLHAHRIAEPSWLQLVVEDDAELARALADAGARLVFEILHLEGPLPADAR